MIQDIPAEETILAMICKDASLSLDSRFHPLILTDQRRELGSLLGKIKLEGGVAGHETLRALGASEDALKLFDIVSYDDPIESFGHVTGHLRKIATNARVHHLCKRFHKETMDADCNPVDWLEDIEREVMGLRDLLDGKKAAGGPTKGNDLTSLMELLERTLSKKGDVFGLKTGFPELDRAMDGFCPGRLYYVGARPSVGKTSLLLSWVKNWLDGYEDQGEQRGMVFTLEMPAADLRYNLMVMMSLFSRDRIRNGLTKDQLLILRRAIQQMSTWDWELDDTPAIPIDLLCHRARKAHADKPLKWIGIDYVQLMKGSSKKSDSRQVELGEISGKLKALAKELSLPIIGLLQVKRLQQVVDSGKGRKVDPRPTLNDLRESGDFEQDGDGICFIHRDQAGEDGIAELLISKNRFGPLRIPGMSMVFDAEFSRYRPK